jgi:hypothetical protein
MDAAVIVEGEQRSIRAGHAARPAALGLLFNEPGDARPVRDEAALAVMRTSA